MCTKGLRYAIEMSIIKFCAGLEGRGCLHILYSLLVNQQYVKNLVGKIEYMENSFLFDSFKIFKYISLII